MKDCLICGTMVPFYGSDLCESCKKKIAERRAKESQAYNEGREAYKDGKPILLNPYPFVQINLFIQWSNGWAVEEFIEKKKLDPGMIHHE